jgi:hypothetical protein
MSVREVSAEEALGGKFMVAPASAFPGLAKWHRQRRDAEAKAAKAKAEHSKAFVMRAVLVRRREKSGVCHSCYAIDLAKARSALDGHLVRIERELFDDYALPSQVIECGDGSFLELFEGVSDIIVT